MVKPAFNLRTNERVSRCADTSAFLQIFLNRYLEKYQQGLRQLERKKVKHEDWNLFQMCLTLMQTTGDYPDNRSLNNIIAQ